MNHRACQLAVLLSAALFTKGALAGPYSAAKNDPTKSDAPIPGFVGAAGDGVVIGNAVNPLFLGWATGIASYLPAPGLDDEFAFPSYALGPVTGDVFDTVSLGDLSDEEITGGTLPGTITLTFNRPIVDRPGADFVVYENGLTSGGLSGVAGQLFGELAYVEVSSNGVDFFRFPSVSNTSIPPGQFGTIDSTNVHQLAGKHGNGYNVSWGTPFDLSSLSGLLDTSHVTHVRLVDIPGNGAYLDSASHPIFDSWYTEYSGGFDLEAIGVISHLITFERWQTDHNLTGIARGLTADADGDGVGNAAEYGLGMNPGKSDTAGLPTATMMNDRPVISFVRDTRKTDVTYVVQSSSNLVDWDDIARSSGGEMTSTQGMDLPAFSIEEVSASPIASVGVLRRVTVVDALPISGGSPRFLRINMEITP